jgi:hypothetical protein
MKSMNNFYQQLPLPVQQLGKDYAKMKIKWFRLPNCPQKDLLRGDMARVLNKVYFYQAINNFPIRLWEEYIKHLIDQQQCNISPKIHEFD